MRHFLKSLARGAGVALAATAIIYGGLLGIVLFAATGFGVF